MIYTVKELNIKCSTSYLIGQDEDGALIFVDCLKCKDTGLQEEIGDGENFECDVIGHKKCGCGLLDD